jgi:polyferredoxin
MTTEKKEKNTPIDSTGREIQRKIITLRSIRNCIQLGVFLLTAGIGLQFFIYVHQASGPDFISVARPPGIEGFLPIGALMGWRVFIHTGHWDMLHPAAMVIFGFAGIVSLMLRKTFCGWFCPVGTLSEWLWKAGERLFGKNYRMPPWLDLPLRSLKYLLLGFFFWIIFSMDISVLFGFLLGHYYKMADVKMLYFFTEMSATTMIVLTILVVSSFLIRNSWCRYFCPYGALMGLLALFSPTRIQRNPDTCTGCKRCSKACPYYLPVDRKQQILSSECNGCMECTLICPQENTLHLKTKGVSKNVWSAAHMGIVIIALFVSLVYTARITGHWKSSLSENEFRGRLLQIESPQYIHPSIRSKN